MEKLIQLADLIAKRNAISREITAITGRPALLGHLGEYIASRVFAIDLASSASNKGFDGYFQKGPLAGRTVNIKWYARKQNLIDLRPDAVPDFYLVITGPPSPAMSSRGEDRPWLIESVFLFDAKQLIDVLCQRGRKIGIATSVPKMLWQQSELFPTPRSNFLRLDDQQRGMLDLYNPGSASANNNA